VRSKYDWNESHRGPSLTELAVYLGIALSMLAIFIAVVFSTKSAEAHDDVNQCCTLDEVLVVASKTPTLQSDMGKSVDVLDSFLLNQYKMSTVAESIHGVPGVEVKETAGLSTVRIRGARSYDTAYTYNGVPLRDPSHPQQSFASFTDDFILLGDTEVELLRGPGSVVYGSESIGGVVNIMEKYNRYSVRVEGGPEWKEVISTPFGSLGRMDGEGKENTSIRLHHDWGWISPWLIHVEAESPLNSSPYILGGRFYPDNNDENDRSEREFSQVGTGLKIGEWGTWTVAYSDSERRYQYLPNQDGSGFHSDGIYHGGEVYSDFRVDSPWGLIGHTYRRDSYSLEVGPDSDEVDKWEHGFYVEKEFEGERWNLLLGARENIHEEAKHRTVWDISGVYDLTDNTKIRSHVATGYRVPSLYELHGAFLSEWGRFEIGNPELGPERSFSYDAGVEHRLDANTTISATYFRNKIENRIDFPMFRYENIDGPYRTEGLELVYERFFFGSALFRLAYTLTDGENLIDIPEHNVQASLRVHKGKWNASVRATYKGEHRINVFNLDTFMVDTPMEEGYVRVDVTVGYEVKDGLEIYVRGSNVFSEDYLDGGYRQPGTEVYGGVKWKV